MAASCENCKKGYIIPGEPTGTMVDGAYFRTAPSGTESKSAIVLLTDIFGLPLINSKIIADLLAEKTGFDVWVPDLFDGACYFLYFRGNAAKCKSLIDILDCIVAVGHRPSCVRSRRP